MKVEASSASGFVPDLKEMMQRYHKRTSDTHKRWVLFMVLAGAVLRGWMLWLPISAAEAKLWVHVVSVPLGQMLSGQTQVQDQMLYGVLAKLSTSLFGMGLIPFRLPAFLASVLVLPVYYLVVRALFNRYIGLMALALAAASGPLVEAAGLAASPALIASCMVAALAFGRHFHKSNNPVSAFGMGAMLALAWWGGPGGVPAALTVLLWSLFHLFTNHGDTLPQRMRGWTIALGTALGLGLLLYAPMIWTHGLLHTLHHASLPDPTWKKFARIHTEGTMALWFHIVDTTGRAVALLGLLGVIAAAAISAKYRHLAMALLFGSALPVMLLHYVPEPQAWTHSLYIFHMASALVLFYLLKWVQEKLLPSLGKRTRVAVTSLLLFAGTSLPAMRFLLTTDRAERFPEAAPLAAYLHEALRPEDRVHVDTPWEDPLIFLLMSTGHGKATLRGLGPEGSLLYTVVDPSLGQSLETVWADQQVDAMLLSPPQILLENGRVKLWLCRVQAARNAEGAH